MFKKIITTTLLLIPSFSMANSTYHFFENPYSLDNYNTPMYSYKVEKTRPNVNYGHSSFYARIEINYSQDFPYAELLGYKYNYSISCHEDTEFEAEIAYTSDKEHRKKFTMIQECKRRINSDRDLKHIQYVYSGKTKEDKQIFTNALKLSNGNATLFFNDNLFSIPTKGFTKALKNKTTPKPATKVVKNLYVPDTSVPSFYNTILTGFIVKDNNSIKKAKHSFKIRPIKDEQGWYPEFSFHKNEYDGHPPKCSNKSNGENRIIKVKVKYQCNGKECSQDLSFEQECAKLAQQDVFISHYTALKIVDSDRKHLLSLFNEPQILEFTIGVGYRAKSIIIASNGYKEHIKIIEEENNRLEKEYIERQKKLQKDKADQEASLDF